MNILHIVETAFRGTLEEQDDTVIWTVHAMRKAGQSGSVLLRGNAVCHAVKAQDTRGLVIGDWRQTNPADLAGDLSRLMSSGVGVYIVDEDLAKRGIEEVELVGGLDHVSQREIAALCDAHDLVWHW